VNGVGLRRALDRAFSVGLALCLWLAVIPVVVLFAFVVIRGLPGLLNLDFFLQRPHPEGVPGGGVANAILGTLIIVGLASLMAVPFGALVGIFLSEFGRNRLGDGVRFVSDVMTGVPSIAFGLFGYSLLVAPLHHFSAIAGSVALAVLMLPLILRATESALLLVPQSLREAGLALGSPRWRVTLQVAVPAALGAIVTGALLAMARAAGETAPLLFTALGNEYIRLNPLTGPMAALSLVVFRNAGLPYQDLQDQAWAAALLLVILVSVTNILARLAVRQVQV
jgi:phosphate transport system permease protein